MKKAIPVIIALVFMLSVVFIGFFGASYAMNDVIDVKDIVFLNNDREQVWRLDEDNNTSVAWDDDRVLDILMTGQYGPENKPVATYLLQIDVLPLDATNNKVSVDVQKAFSPDDAEFGTTHEWKLKDLTENDYILSFYKIGNYTVYVKSTDGTGIVAEMLIRVDKPL